MEGPSEDETTAQDQRAAAMALLEDVRTVLMEEDLPGPKKRRQAERESEPTRGSSSASASGPPAADAAVFATSVVDSDDEGAADAGLNVGALGRPATEGGDRLTYQGERIDLEPGDGAWVPVRRERRQGPSDETKTTGTISKSIFPKGLWMGF